MDYFWKKETQTVSDHQAGLGRAFVFTAPTVDRLVKGKAEVPEHPTLQSMSGTGATTKPKHNPTTVLTRSLYE